MFPQLRGLEYIIKGCIKHQALDHPTIKTIMKDSISPRNISGCCLAKMLQQSPVSDKKTPMVATPGSVTTSCAGEFYLQDVWKGKALLLISPCEKRLFFSPHQYEGFSANSQLYTMPAGSFWPCHFMAVPQLYPVPF